MEGTGPRRERQQLRGERKQEHRVVHRPFSQREDLGNLIAEINEDQHMDEDEEYMAKVRARM